MVDTLQQIRNELPDTPLCLLLGGDAFSYFLDWRQPETIIELCHLIIMGRPGYQLPAHGPLGRFTAQRCIDDPGTLATRPSGDIWMQKVTQLDISSSDIRARLAQGLSVRYLLPDSVIEIIEQQRLYGTATESCS
jgi:nicotinate-nucleotide adenylyltransferase